MPPRLRLAALACLLLAATPCRAEDPASPTPAVAGVPVKGSGPPCPNNPAALGTGREIGIDPTASLRLGLKTYPRTLDLHDHEVVLTFDDGPSARTTPQVLDALEHECVRATFFLIGRNALSAKALVRREIADGDIVGHHSWSHPAVTERGLSETDAEADIERGFQADDQAGYGNLMGAPRVPFFRFPGFADSPALLRWLDTRHVAVFGADLWASDWVRQTPEAELKLLMDRLDRDRRGIILLHDTKPQTAAMMPALLQTLRQGGYSVATLRPGGGPTPVRHALEGWTSETGKTIKAEWPEIVRLAQAHARPASSPSTAGVDRRSRPPP